MQTLEAQVVIVMPDVRRHLRAILELLSAHDMTVAPEGEGYSVTSSFGAASLHPAQGALAISMTAAEPAMFNRLKHDLIELIAFVTRPETLQVTWSGEAVGVVRPPDLRILTVRGVEDLTPRMRRFSFSGDDLSRYASPDQIHCRLLFPHKGAADPQWPQLDDEGHIVWPQTGKLPSRIFTIRHIDPVAGRLDIDFVLHDGIGPGASWAARAAKGDVVGILGPATRGPKSANWHLLAGDETGLPGIARILEGLPASARGVALIEVASAADEQAIDAPPGVRIRWLHRNGAAPGTTTLLSDALRRLDLPTDSDGISAWLGAEFSAFRDMRTYLLAETRLPASRLVAFSHWRRGMSEEDIVAAGITAISA